MPNAPSDVVAPIDHELFTGATQAQPVQPAVRPAAPTERGGPAGPEPTRFGDWERNGRCIDF